jgi:hypothetical protein
VNDQLDRPGKRDELAAEAVGSGGQGEFEVAPLRRLRRLHLSRFDDAYVGLSLAAREPEQSKLDAAWRCVKVPFGAAAQQVTRPIARRLRVKLEIQLRHD